MNDFVISVATQDVITGNAINTFKLSNYQATEDKTAYKVMRDLVVEQYKSEEVQWLSVALTISNQYICVMKGTLDWLKKVEYFQKFIGSAADDNFQQASFGFLDLENDLRIEFENGMINILPQK